MLLLAARIVNSTPLFDPPELPNDPEPITPHMLLTQRDDKCKLEYIRPTVYNPDDLLAYGTQRYKRAEALADEFAIYWKNYLFQIGDTREKWLTPQRNAKRGDLVLLLDKNLHLLEWLTGNITSVIPSKDGLVRKLTVQPFKKSGQKTIPLLVREPSMI